MVSTLRQSQKTEACLAWEGLIRAACASAAAQPQDSIRAVTISHRTDQLTAQERAWLLPFAQSLARELGLELETEQQLQRLVLRFSRATAGLSKETASESCGLNIRALWHLLVWRRRHED
jgi:hypothetical protein